MQFPITRERLQNLTKEFEEDQIKNFINNTVEDVKNAILEKAYNDSLEKAYYDSPNSNAIPAASLRNNKLKMLKLNLPLQASPYSKNRITNPIFTPPYNQWNSYLPVILEKLQELFPDVSFQVDPLKTYLLIDWS